MSRDVLAQESGAVSLSVGNLSYVVVVAVIALVALAMASVFRREVLAAPEGTARMQSIGNAVQEGASAYLNRQFRTLSVFVVLVCALLFALPGDADIRIGRSIFFIVGAVFSASIGYLGMSLATKANMRVAAAANDEGRDPAMRIAFRTGGTVGMATVGLGLLGAAVVVFIYRGDAPNVLEGFGFGAALLAMFMRVGGGIFTKAADVGADLVGKSKWASPRRSAQRSHHRANVGDNVGDWREMAADLFESYAVTSWPRSSWVGGVRGRGPVFPLLVPALGAITAIIGVYVTRAASWRERLDHDQTVLLSVRGSGGALCGRGLIYLRFVVRGAQRRPATSRATPASRILASAAVVIRIVLAGIILSLTGYFTGHRQAPRQDVALTSLTGRRRSSCRHLAGSRVGGLHRPSDWADVLDGRTFGSGGGSVIISLSSSPSRNRLTDDGRRHFAMDTFGGSDNAQGTPRCRVTSTDDGGRSSPSSMLRQHHQSDYEGHRDRQRAGGDCALCVVHRCGPDRARRLSARRPVLYRCPSPTRSSRPTPWSESFSALLSSFSSLGSPSMR